jgi:hypothetical protein
MACLVAAQVRTLLGWVTALTVMVLELRVVHGLPMNLGMPVTGTFLDCTVYDIL